MSSRHWKPSAMLSHTAPSTSVICTKEYCSLPNSFQRGTPVVSSSETSVPCPGRPRFDGHAVDRPRVATSDGTFGGNCPDTNTVPPDDDAPTTLSHGPS